MDHVSWSHLKEMAVSPLAYRHSVDTPREDTAAYRFGRALHCAVLEPDAFEARFAVYPGPVRRGKEWEAFKAAHAKDEIITADEKERAKLAGEAVHAHPLASEIACASGRRELTVEWDDEETDIHLLSRIDLFTDEGRLVEIKSVSDPDPRKFCGDVARYLYHGQIALYTDGLLSTGEAIGRPPTIVEVQSEAPYDVVVWTVEEAVVERGRVLYRKLLTRLAECQAAGKWQGISETAMSLYLPQWAQ